MVVSWDFWNLLAMKGFLWEDQTTEGENALAGETTGVKDNSNDNKQRCSTSVLDSDTWNVIYCSSELSVHLPINLSVCQSSTYVFTYLPTT